jgi:hypothetical protein
MVEIQNCLSQPVLVNRGKATPLHLLAHARAVLDESEVKCGHVQMLIASGVLRTRRLKQDKPDEEAAPERRAERRAGGNESTAKKTEG